MAVTKRVIEFDVYHYEDLDEKAKERALDWYAETTNENWDSNDSEHIEEMFRYRLDELGLPSKKIEWSLGYSQGDGVAFYGPISMREYLSKNPLPQFDDLARYWADVDMRIEKRGGRGHCTHSKCMKVVADALTFDEALPGVEESLGALIEHIQDQIETLSREFEKSGYEEIEYMTRGEGAVESIIANEYEFDAKGNRLRV
jgi:hypothetical protein